MPDARASTLVGRAAEQRSIEEWLVADERLITLTGPVGVGKSRLARAVMDNVATSGAFEGTRYACLAGAADEAALLSALDEAGVAEALLGGQESLGGDGAFLLLLDDCEPAVALLRTKLDDWLYRHPGLSVLVTCRELLALPTERATELSPLSHSSEFEGPAAELLVEHARRARPGYEPTAAERPILVELLKELDGLPLGIELSAPRLSVMAPAALLHRMRQGGGAARGGGELPRALESAFAGAWSALDTTQQRALGRLSVFPGSFELEAAEAVLDAAAGGVELTSALRARSWLQANNSEDGGVRLQLLASVRRFAQRQADAEQIAEARQCHAAYFADLAERGATDEGLHLERHNLDAVIESVLGRKDLTRREAEPALRVLSALYASADQAPPLRHLSVLDGVLQRSRDSGADPMLICRTLVATGSARQHAGDGASALRDLSRADKLASALERSELRGAARLGLSRVLHDQGEAGLAAQHAQEALTLLSTAGDLLGEARALRALARARAELGEDAACVFERASALFASQQDDVAARQACIDLALAYLDRGQHEAVSRVLHGLSGADAAPEALRRDLTAAMLAYDRGQGGDGSQLQELAQRARALQDGACEAQALVLAALAAAGSKKLGEAHALLRAADGIGALGARVRRVAQRLSTWLDAEVLAPEAGEAAPSVSDEDAKRCFWTRCLSRALRPQAYVAPKAPTDALVIGSAGRWFRTPGGQAVSLHRRRTLSRIADALAQQREADPGKPLSWAELQAAAWPGEKLVKDAGAHRVRVAVSSLRKLGLGEFLLTRGDGYLLTTDCPLFVDASETAR